MPDKITYYAVVGSGRTVEEPYGLAISVVTGCRGKVLGLGPLVGPSVM